jgi:hypothetical protein
VVYLLSKAFWLVAQPGNLLTLLLVLGALLQFTRWQQPWVARHRAQGRQGSAKLRGELAHLRRQNGSAAVIQQQRFSFSRAREKLKANPKDTTMAAWFDIPSALAWRIMYWGTTMADNSALAAAAADEGITAEAPVDGAEAARFRRAAASRDRIFLRLGPNGALGAGEHQWILYRAKIAENPRPEGVLRRRLAAGCGVH